MRLPPVLLLLLVVLPARAQLLDSISLFAEQEPRFVAKLDVRGGFISNRNVRVMGAKAGLEHAGRFQYGIGYAFLFTPVERERFIPELGLTNTRLRIGYVTPYVDYAFYQRGPWEVRLPVQLGIGAGSTIYRDASGRKRRLQRTGLLIYEPVMVVQYRFFRYAALTGGWGFRLVWQTGDQLGERLNAPIYTFGLRIFFGDLWRDLRRPQ
ncbi:MAG: hypothetical protein KIT10_10060 [Flavobacteriales bacterium]|nr:hypothetical protein [Flavobacteriales bacterium]